MSIAVTNRINDLNAVLRTTEDHSLTQLEEIAQEIGCWEQKVRTVPVSKQFVSYYDCSIIYQLCV